MNPERWRLVDRLFAEALELPAPERTAFLESRAFDDAEVQREVRELLVAEAASERFLTPLIEGASGTAPAIGDEAMIGGTVGAYRLERILGRGGMSTVYLGRRVDGQYHQDVAVKLIRRGFENARTLHRFRTERQILAHLEHPSIARLYDGGTTGDGRPYLVMELVDGLAIDAYCDRHQVGIAGRLALVRQVCAAVGHAHRNLLVHRDLKPSNILVTSAGAVKLLDFGIAKLLADQGWAPPAPAEAAGDGPREAAPGWSPVGTETGVRPMTPSYASPEQLRGEVITTATDVYALGVILYRLLTGRHPHPRGDDRQAFERAVLETDPEVPSRVVAGSRGDAGDAGIRRVGTRRWARRLRGDLDAIVSKALAKRPADRYGSAHELDADLARHRALRPVAARAPSTAYRCGRFLRRHAFAVALSSTALLLTVAFVWVAWQQHRRILEERNTAQVERVRAEQVSTFLLGLFDQADPDASSGGELTVREVLDRGSAAIDQLADQPERQAIHLLTTARVYRALGELDRARALLERSLEIRRRLGGDELELARVLNELGSVWQDQGRHAEAESRLREALAIRRRLPDGDHRDLAEALNNLGLLLYFQGKYDQANPMLREALELCTSHFGRSVEPTASVMNNLALSLHETGAHEAAEALYREALAIRRRLFDGDHTLVAVSLHNLAALRHDQGQSRSAEATFREALAMRRRLLGDAHPSLVATLAGLGGSLFVQGRYGEAEAVLREAQAMGVEVLGAGHWRVADVETSLARVLLATGRLGEAEELAGRALEALRAALPGGHVRTAYATAVLGGCRSLAGRDGAGALLADGYEALRARLGPREPMTLDALALLAAHDARSGRPQLAAERRAELDRWRPRGTLQAPDAALDPSQNWK